MLENTLIILFELLATSVFRRVSHFQWFVEDIRFQLIEHIASNYTPATAGVVAGMVLGQEELLGESLRHSLKVTGMQHVISASGFNVGLVLWLVQWLLKPWSWPRRLQLVVSIVLVWGYVALAGAGPSLIRAATMCTLSLLAQWHHRRVKAGWLLGLAVGWWWLVQPELVKSISFQLSASATAGLIWVLPAISGKSRNWWAERELGGVMTNGATESSSWRPRSYLTQYVRESLQLTVAAQSLTLPLLLLYFGELSLLSFFANTTLLWLTPVITILGALWLLITPVMALGPPILSSWLWWPLSGVIELASWCFVTLLHVIARFDWLFFELEFEFQAWWVGVWWLSLAFFVWWRRR